MAVVTLLQVGGFGATLECLWCASVNREKVRFRENLYYLLVSVFYCNYVTEKDRRRYDFLK